MPALLQDYETTPLDPARDLFGLLQAPVMMSQPTIWKQSPDSYHMHNDMPEPEIINLEYDDVDENIENDTLALFNSIEDSIWNTLPLWNSRLREKMCQVVHLNVVEVLTLLVLPIDPDSERYHTLYACLFHALVVKKVAWKTSDSCACMPSMTAIDDYLLQCCLGKF